MIGNTQITVITEQIAYPLESDYFPMIRVFESPYAVGDCPIDEVTLRDNVPSIYSDEWGALEGTSVRATISPTEVSIIALEDNNYEAGKEYELRVYPSDELVQREETPTEE